MKSKFGRRTRSRWLAAIALLLPLASACSIGGGNEANRSSPDIDAPPATMEQSMLKQADTQANDSSTANMGAESSAQAAQAAPANSQNGQAAEAAKEDANAAATTEAANETVTVYMLDPNGYLAPMTMRLGAKPFDSAASSGRQAPQKPTLAETALSWMIDDEHTNDQLPAGFAAALPAGTKVASVKTDANERTVSVDFAASLPALPAGKERKALEALVWTLTELPGVDNVVLTVAGKPLGKLGGANIPVDGKITRGIGINLEKAKDVQTSRSMGVTLYFASRTEEGDGYFVPVTRLINREEDKTKAALRELVKGPADLTALSPVLTPDLSVDQLTTAAGTINVSLHSDGWTRETPVAAQSMEALVLTMTEATGAPQVKLAINGDDSFLDSDNNSYDKPVTRPVFINTIKQ